MAVTVRLPAVLRPFANGQSTVNVDAATVSEAVGSLVEQFPDIKANLLNDDGSLHRFINVYVNDEDVRYLDQMATSVSAGDELSILPAVAGGR